VNKGRISIMAWSISISAEGWQQICEACHTSTRDFLLEAINETANQNGTGGITSEAEAFISHESLADIVFQLIQETNTCDNGGFHYWIDPKGIYKISIS